MNPASIPAVRKLASVSAALRVAFLSVDGGRAARCAASLIRGLVPAGITVQAADFDHAEAALAKNGTAPSLIVVLHAPGTPPPPLVADSGGRIDWYLQDDPTTHPGAVTLQLWRYVVRLLDDLRVDIGRSASSLLRPAWRSLRFNPAEPFFRWCPPPPLAFAPVRALPG
jgi:hypothetical protein